jgi:hypothetical protein
MIRTFIFLLLLSCPAWAQPKFETREFSGQLKSIDPFWDFSNERLTISDGNAVHTFAFHPRYGEFISEHFKIGNPIKVRVKVNLTRGAMVTKVRGPVLQYWFRDNIIGVEVNNEWIEFEEKNPGGSSRSEIRMHLDKPVRKVVEVENYKRGFVFDKGIVAYNYNVGLRMTNNQEIKEGDRVSFIGHLMPRVDGANYPIDGVREVISFSRLIKFHGEIKSLLFKQNHVCIGLTLGSGSRELRLSFPGNYAERVKQFADRPQPVIAYFSGQELDEELKDDLNPPELHALIQGSDTLKILDYGFWGGADIKHEHTEASLKGKITQVNKLPSGKIYSVIIDNQAFIDIDHATQKQLGALFRKGKVLEVSGKERIKAQGEVYKEDYRIITPDKITIDGKVFQINQLP